MCYLYMLYVKHIWLNRLWYFVHVNFIRTASKWLNRMYTTQTPLLSAVPLLRYLLFDVYIAYYLSI